MSLNRTPGNPACHVATVLRKMIGSIVLALLLFCQSINTGRCLRANGTHDEISEAAQRHRLRRSLTFPHPSMLLVCNWWIDEIASLIERNVLIVDCSARMSRIILPSWSCVIRGRKWWNNISAACTIWKLISILWEFIATDRYTVSVIRIIKTTVGTACVNECTRSFSRYAILRRVRPIFRTACFPQTPSRRSPTFPELSSERVHGAKEIDRRANRDGCMYFRRFFRRRG